MNTTEEVVVYPKMNPEVKAKWLDALRSGKYEQGERVLRMGNRYCCLGVLQEIVAPQEDFLRSYLPEHVAVTVGLELIPAPESAQGILSRMNDGTALLPKHSFAEIADWIEANL